MQRLMLGDVVAFASALAGVASKDQRAFGQDILHRADQAEAFRKTWGRAHPDWGAGSLMAAARSAGQSGVLDWQEAEVLTAFSLACQLLVGHFSGVSRTHSRCTAEPSDQVPDA